MVIDIGGIRVFSMASPWEAKGNCPEDLLDFIGVDGSHKLLFVHSLFGLSHNMCEGCNEYKVGKRRACQCT